ncbi:polysaccharide deacetylase family protein [Streptosporangium roseum]|uniref:Chitin deacetylase n=1 Tax=Streptosporangium roseum (strain ATCC 12428 / DSM 43021 / JCM 3005 / KCTC 9067 / NCIMB 10171 / NRRL 2505 / NI 9100) TaxID=479432 RepID=D2AVJ0_STRRD|nr:polysaccharide deacetylase family protein [Streptosporangium roseum]ACZ90636.1 chitin deacetylase [Streptosporangium roseum DSM 43021]
MRLCTVLLALLLGAGGCAAPAAHLRSEGVPVSVAPAAPEPPAARRRPPPIDPEKLAEKLAAIQPQWPVDRYPLPPAARHIDCRRVKCVALTYDDGPGGYTGQLLDILARHHARATFFVIGQKVAEDGPHTLRRMVTEGHEIGNHTWSHTQLTALSDAGIKGELGRAQGIVHHVTGRWMTLMRPPYGATGRRVADEARRRGLAQILWDVDTLDWRDRDSLIVTQRAVAVTPGSVVLMHDIHSTTVEAATQVLDMLALQGYTFVTVSELYGKTLIPGKVYAGEARSAGG